MYQLREIEGRHEHGHVRLEKAEMKRPDARRNGAARPDAYLRVARVPGGFAYVADEPATSEA